MIDEVLQMHICRDEGIAFYEKALFDDSCRPVFTNGLQRRESAWDTSCGDWKSERDDA